MFKKGKYSIAIKVHQPNAKRLQQAVVAVDLTSLIDDGYKGCPLCDS